MTLSTGCCLGATMRCVNATSLNNAPAHLGFVFNRLNLFVTGTVGRRIITPYGGFQPKEKGVLLLAIPIVGHEGKPTIPPEFERVTYGTFYDAMNPDQLD